MYLRTTQRRNRDGSVVRYIQLAHNQRVGGVTQAQVLANLGREDQLDRDGVRRLVASINRYLDESGSSGGAHEVGKAGPLQVESARPFGLVWLLHQLWSLLGIDTALASVVGDRRSAPRWSRSVRAGGQPSGDAVVEAGRGRARSRRGCRGGGGRWSPT